MPMPRRRFCASKAWRSASRCVTSGEPPSRSSIPTATRSSSSSGPADGDGGRGLLAAGPAGRRCERLRAVPPHGRAAGAAEDAGGDGPSRRAALSDRASVVGALAEARVLRSRDGDAAAARPRRRRGAPAAPARERLPEDRDAAPRHARAHVAVGVPDDPTDPRSRQRLRLARLPQHPPRLAVARRGIQRAAPRARALARRPLRARPRVRGAVPARRGAHRVGRARLGVALPPLQGRRPRDRRRGRRHAGHARRAARRPDQEQDVPRALAGAQRPDVPRERGRGLSATTLRAFEVHESDGAFQALEDYLDDAGFWGAEGLVADVYLGYGLAQAIRRDPAPPPPEPCALPLLACRIEQCPGTRSRDMAGFVVGEWTPSWAPAAYAAAVDDVRGAIARGERVPGEPRPAPLGAVRRRARRARGGARAAAAASAAAACRGRVGDRIRVAGALPRAPTVAVSGRN